ncbi:MAG: Ig-like domain-containing protein [Longimicrobiales bacterium]
MPRTVWPTLILLATALIACGGGTDPEVPSQVVVSPSAQTAQSIGETLQFTAQVRDASGNTITGLTITWSSTDATVATVDATGLATATGIGQTSIRATVQSVSGTATLNVDLEPAEVQKVSGDEQTAPALSVLPVNPTVRVVDDNGDPIPGVNVTFSIVSGGGVVTPQTVATDGSGDASTEWTLGLPEGTQSIRATAGTLQADFTVTATEPLLSVSTLSLLDARATLAYDGTLSAVGGSSPYTWNVIGGAPPSGITVESDGDISGVASSPSSGTFTARVTDATGDTASRSLTLTVCDAPLSLAPGGVSVSTPAPSGCAPFIPSGDDGDRYRVGVVRTTLSDGLDPGESGFLAPATVSVTAVGAAPAPPAQTRRSSIRLVRDLPPNLRNAIERQEATAAFHRKMFAEGQRLIQELGRDAVAPDRGNRSSAQPSLQAAMVVDPPDRIMLKPYASSTTCSGGTPSEVPAQLVSFSDVIAIYQDSAQRVSDPILAADADRVLAYYDSYGESTITEYFGGVTDINADARVTVFVSPAVSGNVAAFVWPGDFLLTTECPASNEQELIYFGEFMFDALAEDPPGYQAMPVLPHEMKHVSSLYKRLVSTFHPTWIEEGSAEIAAEISSRKAMEAVGDVDQGALLTRDAFPPMNIADEENFGVLIRMSRLTRSYSAPINALTDNPEESPDHTFYGTSWHFHRFLGDAYGNAAGKADGAFYTMLNDSLTAAGTAGFTAVTGQSTTVLLEQYAAAMMLNGAGVPQPTRSFTTYEFPTATDIFIPSFQPPGEYPWPETGPSPLGFTDGEYQGDLAPGGLRVHDFESDGTGDGIEVRATIGTGAAARVVIVRVN